MSGVVIDQVDRNSLFDPASTIPNPKISLPRRTSNLPRQREKKSDRNLLGINLSLSQNVYVAGKAFLRQG